jgi:hypothetical protein
MQVSQTILIRKITITETPPPPTFTISPSSPAITCGSTTAQNFTANNVYNSPGVTNHVWNLGSTSNGWLYNGNPAPQTISTSTTNTIALTPVCGSSQNNISATVTANGTNYNSNSTTISYTQPTLSINGSNSFCSGNPVYSVTNLPCGATVSWSSNPTGVVSISTSSNQATLTKIADGQTTLSATITACGSQIVSYLFIEVGLPQAPQFIEIYGHGVTDPTTLCPGSYRAEAFTTLTNQQYEWRLPPEWSSSASGGNNPFTVGSNGFDIPLQVNSITDNPAFMWVRTVNGCGTSDPTFLFVGTSCDGFLSYQVSPNPATSNVRIDGSKNNKIIKEVQLIDKTGNIKRARKYNGDLKLVQFDVSGLKPDVYYIKIYDGKRWESKQLRIQ